jgi:hypothetical protein
MGRILSPLMRNAHRLDIGRKRERDTHERENPTGTGRISGFADRTGSGDSYLLLGRLVLRQECMNSNYTGVGRDTGASSTGTKDLVQKFTKVAQFLAMHRFGARTKDLVR